MDGEYACLKEIQAYQLSLGWLEYRILIILHNKVNSSFQHVYFFADRVVKGKVLGQKPLDTFLPLLLLELSEHKSGQWSHPQVLGKAPLP